MGAERTSAIDIATVLKLCKTAIYIHIGQTDDTAHRRFRQFAKAMSNN